MIYQSLVSLMMFVLNLAFKFAAGKSPEFRESLQRTGLTVQINVGPSRRRRRLEGGRWRKIAADGSTPDVLLEWTGSRAALGCLAHLDPAAVIKAHLDALTDGRLSLEADLGALHRLGMMMKQLQETFSPKPQGGAKGEKAYAG